MHNTSAADLDPKGAASCKRPGPQVATTLAT
jgi:hypothetical protein